MFPTTNLSIVVGLQQSAVRDAAWRRFQSLYEGPILDWCRRRGLQLPDAEDVTQSVLWKLYEALTRARYDCDRGPFRPWLRQVIANTLRDHFREMERKPAQRGSGGDAALVMLHEIPSTDEVEQLVTAIDQVRDPLLVRAVEETQERVTPKNWSVFRQLVFEEQEPRSVAEESGMSVAAVYKVKSRIGQMIASRFREIVANKS